MDLLSSNPYWRIKHGLVKTYPTLQELTSSQVLIVGGGISGALLAYFLVQAGFETILIEDYDIGSGSTSGSTALIQYEVDHTIQELTKKLGSKNAERAYRACYESVFDLEKIAKTVGHKEFKKRKSIYLAEDDKGAQHLEQEVSLRKKLGFEAEYLSNSDLAKLFPFSRPGALMTDHAAELDPYIFTHQILKYCVKKGLRIFDRTRMLDFTSDKKGIEVNISGGKKILCKQMILATGYECAKYLPKKLVHLNSSFALISKPLASKDLSSWYEQCLLWEKKVPYSYLRTTRDGRILIGGLDEEFFDPKKRDRLIPQKKKKLEQEFKKFFPDIPFDAAYAWAGTFAETKDGLAYVGRLPKHKNIFFSCGYGGNGISFSAVAGRIIRDTLLGEKNEHLQTFSLKRGK